MRSWGHPVAATRHPHVADLWHVQRHVSCNHNFRPPLCALFPVFQVETFAAYSILLPCIPNHFRTPHLGFSLRPYGPLSPFHQTHNAPPPPPGAILWAPVVAALGSILAAPSPAALKARQEAAVAAAVAAAQREAANKVGGGGGCWGGKAL